jgi:UDP-3-O-[3-hydroxymyristoyl] glucosamine N-acyltransferase
MLSQRLAEASFQNEVVGDAEAEIRAVSTLEDAKAGEISFLSNPKYNKQLETTKATAVIVGRDIEKRDGLSLIRCDDPYAAVTAAIILIHGHRKHPQWGPGQRAVIHPSAKIGTNANIGQGVTIAANVVIGDNATLYPGCYIADNVTIGHNVQLYPNVVIYDGCRLGHRVTIHANSVIGEDGLGYAKHEGQWLKIPQVGIAILGDDVEIGAGCTIDRATLGATVIGDGTKFSNLIAIGHGTKIGKHNMYVAQVGLAGSVNVGDNVTMAGQVGVAGHLEIGENVSIGAKAGVSKSLPPNMTALGAPAIDINQAKRQLLAAQKLPDLRQELKTLRRKIEELETRLGGL